MQKLVLIMHMNMYSNDFHSTPDTPTPDSIQIVSYCATAALS